MWLIVIIHFSVKQPNSVEKHLRLSLSFVKRFKHSGNSGEQTTTTTKIVPKTTTVIRRK